MAVPNKNNGTKINNYMLSIHIHSRLTENIQNKKLETPIAKSILGSKYIEKSVIKIDISNHQIVLS